MAHWVTLASNHADLGRSLVAMVHRNLPHLVASVPPEFQNKGAALAANTGFDMAASCDGFLLKNCTVEPPGVQLGNLPWLCHNLVRPAASTAPPRPTLTAVRQWWQYRLERDAAAADALLRRTLVPTLTRAMEFYLALLIEGADGKLHLPNAESPECGWRTAHRAAAAPECPPDGTAEDTNYDLSLLTWGLHTLQAIARSGKAGLDEDPRWEATLHQLTDFPTGPSGLLVGAGVALTHGHRHWSHLFAIFPLMVINATSSLAKLSLDHYSDLNGAELPEPKTANGFPRVAISAMSALIPGREEAGERPLACGACRDGPAHCARKLGRICRPGFDRLPPTAISTSR